MAWWRAGTPEGRRALVAGGLGWMLDSFDVMLYALVLAALMTDLGMAKPTAGLLGSADARGLGRRRPRVRRRRGSLRPHARADGEHPDLLRLHRGVRLRADRGPARRLPRVPGARHGRRVGERRGAGVGDLVRRAPRQGARLHAERVGDRLRRWRRSWWPSSCRSGDGAPCSSSACCRRSSRCGSSAGSRSPPSGAPGRPRRRPGGAGLADVFRGRLRRLTIAVTLMNACTMFALVGVQPVDPRVPLAARRATAASASARE